MPEKEVQNFEAGSQIILKPESTILLREYGPEPFDVLDVYPVPVNECACGSPLGECFFSHDDVFGPCNQTAIESVGHHQWVTIARNGVPIYDSRGNIQRFSGGWFKNN